MQNINVQRYSDPKSVGYVASISPDDGAWILFVPVNGSAPALFINGESGYTLA
jgi:hypothetical protein